MKIVVLSYEGDWARSKVAWTTHQVVDARVINDDTPVSEAEEALKIEASRQQEHVGYPTLIEWARDFDGTLFGVVVDDNGSRYAITTINR